MTDEQDKGLASMLDEVIAEGVEEAAPVATEKASDEPPVPLSFVEYLRRISEGGPEHLRPAAAALAEDEASLTREAISTTTDPLRLEALALALGTLAKHALAYWKPLLKLSASGETTAASEDLANTSRLARALVSALQAQPAGDKRDAAVDRMLTVARGLERWIAAPDTIEEATARRKIREREEREERERRSQPALSRQIADAPAAANTISLDRTRLVRVAWVAMAVLVLVVLRQGIQITQGPPPQDIDHVREVLREAESCHHWSNTLTVIVDPSWRFVSRTRREGQLRKILDLGLDTSFDRIGILAATGEWLAVLEPDGSLRWDPSPTDG